MNTDENNQDGVVTEETTQETDVAENQDDKVILTKEEYTKLNETLGSLKREVKDLKKPKETPKEVQQPSEPDYGELAITRLEVRGFTNPDDQKTIIDEAKRLKLNAAEVAEMPHIKAKLEAAQKQRAAQDGMPNGSGRKGGNTRSDVEFYLENPDQTPTDPELAYKVIDAKMKRETSQNKFSADLYTG